MSKTKEEIEKELIKVIDCSDISSTINNLTEYAFLLYQQGILQGSKETIEELRNDK